MYPDSDVDVEEYEEIFEALGKLETNFSNKGLMHSVLENDEQTIEDGKLISNSINQGMGAFNPDLMFKNMVNDYSLAKSLYGEAMIRRISGYDPEYVEKNVHIPEFRDRLKEEIDSQVESLRKKKLIDDDFSITEKGIELASLTMYMEELNELTPKGMFGSKSKKKGHEGDRDNVVKYKNQRYRDIALRKSIKLAARRKHTNVEKQDLKAYNRESKGRIFIVYCLDTSGSMKGDKLAQCKKAGIALAYRANENKDKVGLIVFGDRVREKIEPTDDFVRLLKTITKARASSETNIAGTLQEAVLLLHDKKATKHIILITDAIPTKGDDPEKATLSAVSEAKSEGITVSLVGIQLDKDGQEMAKKIVGIGGGRLYSAKDTQNIDKLVLEDYTEL